VVGIVSGGINLKDAQELASPTAGIGLGDKVVLVLADDQKRLSVRVSEGGNDLEKGRLSASSPLRRATFGLEEGDEAELSLENGRQRRTGSPATTRFRAECAWCSVIGPSRLSGHFLSTPSLYDLAAQGEARSRGDLIDSGACSIASTSPIAWTRLLTSSSKSMAGYYHFRLAFAFPVHVHMLRPRLRLRPGQCQPRHATHPRLARPSIDPAHDALHAAELGVVQ
jgi:hypothetical protein